MGYGMRKFPRYGDAVTFDDAEPDYRGFPNIGMLFRFGLDLPKQTFPLVFQMQEFAGYVQGGQYGGCQGG